VNVDIRGGGLRWLESVASTNDHAITLAEEGAPSGTVVAADAQTGGKGRLGRAWHSPPGKNIYMSVILRPEIPLKEMPLITLMCAVEAGAAIKEQTGTTAGLKWPNDLFLEMRKLGGILVESRVEAGKVLFVVAGIGINVNARKEDFPPELQDIATSIFMHTGREHGREVLLKAVAEGFIAGSDALAHGGAGDILRLWKLMSVTLGRRVRAEDADRVYEGTAVDLDESGRLVIRTDSGKDVRLVSGDVYLL
jgi:BirA family biotin operon repressor/biotin-[acetyl-CoA-carboxylase] ligase